MIPWKQLGRRYFFAALIIFAGALLVAGCSEGESGDDTSPEAAGSVPTNIGDTQPGQEPDENLLDVIDDLSQPSPGAFEIQPDQPDPVVRSIGDEPCGGVASHLEPRATPIHVA